MLRAAPRGAPSPAVPGSRLRAPRPRGDFRPRGEETASAPDGGKKPREPDPPVGVWLGSASARGRDGDAAGAPAAAQRLSRAPRAESGGPGIAPSILGTGAGGQPRSETPRAPGPAVRPRLGTNTLSTMGMFAAT